MTNVIPVLWLYGPAGVGKTTAAWELFTRLSREGMAPGYVDIDQLGMCYAAPTAENWAPEPESDPGRHAVKIRNLGAVVANFRAAGARCVVVSGVVDPERGADTVGWQVYQQIRRAGSHTAFLDLDQIGFYRPGPSSAGDPESPVTPSNHQLKADNLAAVWQNFHARGAQRLIVVGPLDRPEAAGLYSAAVPQATLTLCRLHAGREQLAERIMLRGQGIGTTFGVPGDELSGRPTAWLRHVVDQASAEIEALEHAGIGDLRVLTDGRPPEEIAREILLRIGWLADTALAG